MGATVMTTPRRRAVAATVAQLSLAIALSMLVAPLTVDGQSARNLPRLGYLASGSTAVEPFRQGLREFGWVEGQNIVIDYRFAEGRHDRLPDLAAELVRLKVDVIVAGPTQFAGAAKNATGTIPIVMWAVGDPIGTGLIVNLARPGGNVTGLSFAVDAGTTVKGLELLKEAVPKGRRVAVLSNPANPSVASVMKAVTVAARSLGVQLQLVEARDPGEFKGGFAAMAKERVAALLVVTDAVFHLHRARLVELAARNRLPSMYGVREFVDAGGLMSYGPSVLDLARRAAAFVDKILKGAKPADLPVEQPTKFELVINLKTARELEFVIPPALLLRADQILE
jgi:putative ABC transport system substrate-binding protein